MIGAYLQACYDSIYDAKILLKELQLVQPIAEILRLHLQGQVIDFTAA